MNLSSNNGSSYDEADIQTLVHFFFTTLEGQVSLISLQPMRTTNIYSRIKHQITSKGLRNPQTLWFEDELLGELPKLRLLSSSLVNAETLRTPRTSYHSPCAGSPVISWDLAKEFTAQLSLW